MALYLGKNKVTPVGLIGSMKPFFEAGGKCASSTATSFDGCWQYDDTANVTDMENMFNYCSNITTVPLFDTSNATNMSNMFGDCTRLTTIPLFDTSKVTNMDFMFQACGSLTTVPQFDTSKVTTMFGMFNGCQSLTTVPQFDTSNVTNMSNMFNYCSKLEAIHMININADIVISYSKKFTHEALLEIIGNLKAQTSGTKTLTMGATNLAKLTDADKKVATDKGWILK